MLVNISLFLTIIFVIVNGSIPSSTTIETDLNELAKLHEEFLHRSPSVTEEVFKVQCRAVDECCSTEKDNLFTFFTENQFYEKCLNNKTVPKTSLASSSCLSTTRQLNKLMKEEIYNRYFEVLGDDSNQNNRYTIWIEQMKMVYPQDDLNAYYCQRDDIEKF